ncbi:MAG: hypothetical protein UV17_C0060G0016 [Candidatus Gottesmanbacteria bacterium GW2011_GWA1_42_26]|nr:MAG: hypothetical protein UV17_C0060G0016 [Candidatus Gottesmanbacteria bacterium GW2011_GWA1_42_26]
MLDKKIAIFQGKQIRRHWDDQKELWYFSVVDVVAALTNSSNPQVYWRVLKKRLIDEGSGETVTKCNGLKMLAPDGKMRLTDAADTEVMLRIIQSIPSPNAEPFKLWLARVGYERLEETADPELAINRALKTYLQKGYSQDWINQRLKSIEIRKFLTDEWEKRGVKEGLEFAILTDEITQAWTGLTTKQYKSLKGLKTATTEISQKRQPKNFPENKKVAKEGGTVAGNARKEIESKTGKKIVTRKNAKRLKLLKEK